MNINLIKRQWLYVQKTALLWIVFTVLVIDIPAPSLLMAMCISGKESRQTTNITSIKFLAAGNDNPSQHPLCGVYNGRHTAIDLALLPPPRTGSARTRAVGNIAEGLILRTLDLRSLCVVSADGIMIPKHSHVSPSIEKEICN